MRALREVAKGMVNAQCIAIVSDHAGSAEEAEKEGDQAREQSRPEEKDEGRGEEARGRRAARGVASEEEDCREAEGQSEGESQGHRQGEGQAEEGQRDPAAASERARARDVRAASVGTRTERRRTRRAREGRRYRASLPRFGGPDAVVHRIHAFIDEVRGTKTDEPQSQDVRLGLGALWGEQLRAQVGWVWVHLTYPDGFASYALVPDDRAFACFPLNRVQELMSAAVRANTTVAIFNSIVAGTLPATRRKNAYLVIG